MQRRQFLGSAAAALTGWLPATTATFAFAGIDLERGHALRACWPGAAARAHAGAARPGHCGRRRGRAAAARSLRGRGARLALLDWKKTPRRQQPGRCGERRGLPLGAHYLPVPGDDAREVQDLLEELGLRQRVAGRWQYDERHLCHSPQERLYFQGQWHEGLLPVQGVAPSTLAQYRALPAVQRLRGRFAMPMPALGQKRLWRPSIKRWMLLLLKLAGQQGWTTRTCAGTWTTAAATTTAPARRVSAWAGIHYFASRHGFHAPGEPVDEARSRAHLARGQRLAHPAPGRTAAAGGQLRTGCSVLRIAEGRHGVEVDALHHASGQVERWQAPRCVVALPVFVAARVVQPAPPSCRPPPSACNGPLAGGQHPPRRAAARPPWRRPRMGQRALPDANPGGLGYVDAYHQRLNTGAPLAPTVLSYYRAGRPATGP
jgi:hypothetical protein